MPKGTSKQTGSAFNIKGNVDTGGGDIAAGNIKKGNVNQSYGLQGDEIKDLFLPVYQQIEQQRKIPAQDKEDLKETVGEIQEELAKGNEASETFIERRMRNIARIAPDILDVVVKTISNPVLGLADLAAKIANKAKDGFAGDENVKKKPLTFGIDGDISTDGGDIAGVIYKQGLNAEELVAALRRAFPKGDPRPDQFRKVLEQFQIFHQTLYEWKELHNALDEIITSFGQFSSKIRYADAANEIPSLSTLRDLWYAVSAKVDALLEFARDIEHIGTQYRERNGELTGEKWAVTISQMRNQINLKIGLSATSSFNVTTQPTINLADRGRLWFGKKPEWWIVLYELNNEFYNKTLEEMHWADKKLRGTATELYTLSKSVFGS